MKLLTVVLGCALVANGVLAWWLLDQRAQQDRLQAELDARRDALDARAAELATRPPAEKPAPMLKGAPPADASPPKAAPTPRADPKPARTERRPKRPARTWPSKEGSARASRAQADVLQIQDAGKRESGIRELVAMLHDDDAPTALAALRALPKLRPVKMDHGTWRPVLLRHLESDDASLSVAAAYALNAVAPEPESDVARYIAMARKHPESATHLAGVAMFANGGKIEGDLADLFVELINSENLREARNVANYLRSRPAPVHVHQAVADAWRRHDKTGEREGLWFHILGQMKPLHRPVLEVIFELVASPKGARSQDLLTGRVVRNTPEEDRPFAAQAAADALGAATDPYIRRELLKILDGLGTRDQFAAVEAFALNEMVPEKERKHAAQVALRIQRR